MRTIRISERDFEAVRLAMLWGMRDKETSIGVYGEDLRAAERRMLKHEISELRRMRGAYQRLFEPLPPRIDIRQVSECEMLTGKKPTVP